MRRTEGPHLEATAISVARGRHVVLRDVDLTLTGGQVVHLVGANGSGKTSLLRVCAGLGRPRSGRLQVDGGRAFVPAQVALAPAMRCGEWLESMRALRGLEPLDWTAATAAGGLSSGLLRSPGRALSTGMMRRVALAEALCSESAMLFLDEPFSGLDAEGGDWLVAELRARAEEGVAVLLTDHSGDAAGRLPVTHRFALEEGRIRVARPPDAIEASACVTIIATHGDGRRLRRTLASRDSDEQLRALLHEGWHIEAVG